MKENNNDFEENMTLGLTNTTEIIEKPKESYYSIRETKYDNRSEKLSNLIIEKENNNQIDENLKNLINNHNNPDDDEEDIDDNELNKISFTKDYIILFILFMSSSFNFSFLYLPFIVETFIYLIFLESISQLGNNIKYFLQFFNFIYSIILLIIKLIFLSYENGKSSIVLDNKNLFLNLGLCYLRDMESSFLFMMSFFSETIILLINMFAIISRKFMGIQFGEEQNIYYAKKRNWDLRTVIILSYCCFLGFAMYNISFLTLLYLFLIQFVFLINSLNFDNKKVKYIFRIIVYIIIILLYLQILLINILNIPKFQEEILFDKKITIDGHIKYYSKWTKLGIIYAFNPSQYNLIEKWTGYFFAVLSFIILIYFSNVILYDHNNDNDSHNCYQIINQDKFIENKITYKNNNNEEYSYKKKLTNYINKKKLEKGVRKIKTLNDKIFSNTSKLANSPLLMFQLSRFISILWIYIYRNFLSLNVFIYLFFSFLYINNKSNKYLALFLLTPTLIITLGSFHLSNIDGYFEYTKNEQKIKYLHFALGKYDYPKIQYLFGHFFYINTMFLINAFFKRRKSSGNQNKRKTHQKLEKQILENDSNIKEPLVPRSTKNVVENIFNNNRTKSINEIDDNENNNENDIIKPNIDNIIMEDEKIDENELYEDNVPEKKEKSMMLLKLLLKTFFNHLDKITLIVMYFVSVYTVNLVHVILVFIFMLQIIFPSKINSILLIILIVLQLLFLFEFIIDLLKVYFRDYFNKHLEVMNLLLLYDGNIFSNELEIFIYAVVYFFHFQYKTYNYSYIKDLLNDNDLILDNIINNKFFNSPNIIKIFAFLGSFLLKVYFWALVIFFIFFSCYFEINFLFGIKLILFFILCYQFLTTIQQPKERKCCSKFINWLFLLYCCLNTFSIYLFQLNIGIFKEMRQNEGFIYKNLPNIGFTKYKNNLYLHFLPHFMTTFIAVLFNWEVKRVYNNINKKIQNEKFGIMKDEDKYSDEESNEEEDEEIKDEFDTDKYYSIRYNKNYIKIKSISSKLIKIHLGLIFTKLYWLFLFFAIGIIYGSYDLSLSMVIYIIIFSIILIKSYHHILIKLTHYISKKSYYISKVIRYKLVEKPRHIEINKYYRLKSFSYLLAFSFIFFILLYFYGIFELFQYGCNEEIFNGCDNSHMSIVVPGETKEDYIKSIAFIFGIYLNIQKEGILTVAWIHLLLSGFIFFGIYIHKFEDKFTNLSVLLQENLRKLLNENNILEKYSDISDLNILIKIGLTVAGIEIPHKTDIENEEKEETQVRVKRGYSYQLNYLNKAKQPRNNTIKEEDDDEIKEEEIKEECEIKEEDEIKGNIIKKDSNKDKKLTIKIEEKKFDNSFLKTNIVKKLLNIIKGSKSNKQKLYEANSKEKIICFIKQLFEEIIIFLLLCTALGKLSIWTFIYLLISFYLIISKRTMWKFYILYCFILVSISIQSLIYITNINGKTSKRINKELIILIKKTLHFPLYEYINNNNLQFFMGLGVNEAQVKIIWIEFIQVIIIYIYLDYFSYSIYQSVINLGESELSKHKMKIERLNLDQRLINEIFYLSDKDFQQYKECLKCFDFNIGNNKNEFLKNLNIKHNKKINYDEINNSELQIITNPVLKELIIKRLMYKQMRERLEKEKKTPFKPIPNYLSMIREILYLNFHCLILIFIILVSIMIAGLLSIFYVSICLYFLIKSDSIYLGKKYYYPKAIKKLLKIAILIDIILQAIYQTPFFTQQEQTPAYKIFRAIGLIKVVDFEDNEIIIKFVQMAEVIGKVIIFFFISLQALIYDSSNFKKYYLVYLLGHKYKFRKMSLINSFKYNNKRIKVFEKSLTIRQESSQAMEDLKNTLEIWNKKLQDISNNMFEKQLKENDIPLDHDINKILPNSNDDNSNDIFNSNLTKSGNSKNNFEVKNINDFVRASFSENYLKSMKKNNREKIYLEPYKIKKKIKDILLGKFVTKLYQWFHKQSASYKTLDLESKYDYEKDAILGHTKITSLIEKEINNQLDIIDLSNFDEKELAKIEFILEAYFDKSKEALLKKEKKEKENTDKLKLELNKIRKNKTISEKNEQTMRHYITKAQIKRINSEKEKKETNKVKTFLRKESEEDILKKVKKKNLFKFKQFEELLQTRLFKEYLTKAYQIKSILFDLQSFFSNNFNWICYFSMILDHILTGHIMTLFFPISILCYAILENPRPKKRYWLLCLYYTIFILCIKFIIQLKIFSIFLNEELFNTIELYINTYKIGFYHYNSGYSGEFLFYIFPESFILTSILIYRNILITDGLWDSTEEEIENIYQASERVCRFKTRTFHNKEDNINDFTSEFLFRHSKNNQFFKKRHIKLKSNISLQSTIDKKNIDPENISLLSDVANNDIKKDQVQVFTFNYKSKIDPKYNEAKKTYFQKLFPKIRNEKPGNNLYPAYTIIMFVLIIYILFFYTRMIQDNTYGPVNLDTTQFSGEMVLFLILHVLIIIFDRVIYISQNPDNILYEYYLYRRNPKNNEGELIEQKELDEIKRKIKEENITNNNYINSPIENIDAIKKEYNIFFIQNEQFNKPLLNKYILHIFTVIFSHILIFFYFPMKGNINLGNDIFCSIQKKCNNFVDNYMIIIFYILYMGYLLFSGLQIKYGFYDFKRKSFFKMEENNLLGKIGNIFKAIPFLYEIKNSIDWTFTSTSFDIFEWNKFEAIYDTIYDTYIDKLDSDSKPIGKKVGKKSKISIGATLSLILILLLITPLILFSSLNPTNKLNNLTEAQLKIYLSFFSTNGAVKNYNLFENNHADSIVSMFRDGDDIWRSYQYSQSLQTRNFEHTQIQRVIFSETSDRNWDLALPHIENLINLLNYTKENDLTSIQLSIEYQLTRLLPADASTCTYTFLVPIYDFNQHQEQGKIILDEIRNALENCTNFTTKIENAYYTPLRLTSSPIVNIIEDKEYFSYRDIQLGFKGCKYVEGEKNYLNSFFTVKTINNSSQTSPFEIHVFNDQISEATSGYSVLTFYITFVLLAGSYIRNFLSSEPEKIILGEMPHAQEIINLCEGVKIARYGYDFKNEEYLYTVLIELMRSPDYLKMLTSSSLQQFKIREKATESDNNLIIE